MTSNNKLFYLLCFSFSPCRYLLHLFTSIPHFVLFSWRNSVWRTYKIDMMAFLNEINRQNQSAQYIQDLKYLPAYKSPFYIWNEYCICTISTICMMGDLKMRWQTDTPISTLNTEQQLKNITKIMNLHMTSPHS